MKKFPRFSKLRMAIWTGLCFSLPLTTWAATDCATVTEPTSGQCSALLSLYSSTAGDSWTKKEGWNTTNTPCTWSGVICVGSDVTELNLSKNNLVGTLPALSALTELQKLDLSDNELSGTPPNSTDLPKLTDMNLSGNPSLYCAGVSQISQAQCNALLSIYDSTDGANWKNKTGWYQTYTPCGTGTAPDLKNGWYGVVCQTGKVIKLRLPDNNLKGELPNLSAFGDLLELNLKDNQLSGPLPDLTGLTKLQTLVVNNNQLEGPLPKSISGLTNLKIVAINDNRFSGDLPELAALVDLETFKCGNNQLLTGAIPALSTLTLLQTFTCNSNQLRGPIPALAGLTNLQTIDVSNNAMTTDDTGKQLLCIDSALDYGDHKPKLSGTPNNLGECVTAISGTVFNDMNANGSQDLSETVRASTTLTLKSKTQPDSKPIPITTNSQGKYQKEVPADTYEVTLGTDGWLQSTPSPPTDGSPYTVELVANQTTEINFGVHPSASVEMKFVKPGVGEVTFKSANFDEQSCQETCTIYYPPDEKVTLTAKIQGYIFSGWGGDCASSPETPDTSETLDTSTTKIVTLADTATPTKCEVNFEKFSCLLLEKLPPDKQIPEPQCYALKLLYENNNGSLWNTHTGWLETLDPCSWYGVDCDTDAKGNLVVTRLELPNNNLVGGLWQADLSPLTSLQTLNLSNNPNLKGTLPEWIGDMPGLQADGSVLKVTGTGFCHMVSHEYGRWYYNVQEPPQGLPSCPPKGPQAVFVMSPQQDIPQTDTQASSTTGTTTEGTPTESTTTGVAEEPVTPPVTTTPDATATGEVDNGGYSGYTVQFDASRSKTSNPRGLIFEYEWTVTDSDGNKYRYVPSKGQPASTSESGDPPTPGESIKPRAYDITLADGTNLTNMPILTDTPKMSLTFPKPAVGQSPVTYKVTLKVKEVINGQPGPEGEQDEQLVPVPTSTLILSKKGDGSGTVIAKQVMTTDPPLKSAVCCGRDYPSEHYNAVVDTQVELIADPPAGSYFKGWTGTGCSAESAGGTTGTETTTGTTDTTGTTGNQPDFSTTPLTLTMKPGEAKTCIAEFLVTEPAPVWMQKLTVFKQGAGSGSVQAQDDTINCGNDNQPDCRENYDQGKHVRLKAVPGLNSNFVRWEIPTTGGSVTAGCAGQTKPVIEVVIPLDRDVACVANFDSDSNLGGIIETDECYGGSCEMDTPEPIEYWFPQHFVNEERMREAMSFVEPVKELLRKQPLDLTDETTLANTWPNQLNNVDFYKRKPVGNWTQSVKIMAGGNIGNKHIEGHYIQVEVTLITPQGDEEDLPILVYFGSKPTITFSGIKGKTSPKISTKSG